MNEITWQASDDNLTISVSGCIDSDSTLDMEQEIRKACSSFPNLPVVLDFDHLDLITSAGLRVILRLKKQHNDTRITNVHSVVYNVLEMTGFTELLDVAKAYRTISVEGCEIIGQGSNGYVCRIDPETIVKVSFKPDFLTEIQQERKLARAAFIMGIPTAISYDVVRIRESGYGAVFELLNAASCASLLANGMKTEEEIAQLSVDLLRLIHGKTADPDILPDIRVRAAEWSGFLKDVLTPNLFSKLSSLFQAIPEDSHVLHGDFHIRNILVQNGEALLIDMDTLSYGHPIFELAGMFMAYQGFYLADHSGVKRFLGISWESASWLWRRMLELYLGTSDETFLCSVENKAKIIGFARILRRTLRRSGNQTKEGRALIAICHAELARLLPQIDTLIF